MPCDSVPTNLDWHGALDPGHVLILGEMHGTGEIASFTAATVCDALRSGRSVGLFVEWPAALQPQLADPAALLANDFFSGTYQDGRRSVAMVDLVHRAESWNAAGSPLTVIAMDPVDGDRNEGMAAAVHTWVAAHPTAVAIVLVGNVHARLTKGWRDNSGYMPLGFRLLDLTDRVRSLDVRYANGTGWNCQPDCGVHPLYGEDQGASLRLEWASTRDAYDGWFYVGTPSASPPAVGGAVQR